MDIVKRYDNKEELYQINYDNKEDKEMDYNKVKGFKCTKKKTDIARTKFTRSVLTCLIREIQQANMNGDKKYKAKPLSLFFSMFD